MASQTPLYYPFFLFTLFLFLFIFYSSFINAKLDLHPSDLKALRVIQRDLGLVHGQPSSHPCNSEGVFCERRLSNSRTYLLRITRIVLNSKRLNGKLSPSIGRLTKLKELSLPNNNLVDRIPQNIVHLTRLEILDLRNNLFSGEVPSQLSSLIHLRVLDVSSNRLSGNLNFLKHFPNLETLNIADNLFTGRVPTSLHSFRSLRHFNFSGNRFLEGTTPIANRLERSYSDSDYSTSVPKRFIFAESSIELNLINASSTPSSRSNKWSYSSSASAPTPVLSQDHKKRKRKLSGFMLGFAVTVVVGSFAVILSGIIFFLLFERARPLVKGGEEWSGPAIFCGPLVKRPEDLLFLLKEDGLSNFEIIGTGGCGVVYKVELPGRKGKMIAIKKVNQPFMGASELAQHDSKFLHKKMRQIRSEINTVGKIRHRNLVPLLAHVPRPDCHYLVYEYMKNGSLQDLLDAVEAGERELDWLTRHKIALSVAAGLDYLHTSQSPKIIHRDLKPANILLDDDMEARIADFGLAKIMSDSRTHITMSKVSGTAGYLAPEYHKTLKCSEKSDIYSFGVVLGLLVIGKFPYDEFFQHTEEMTLVRWMRNVMSWENPYEAIDARLLGNGYEEEMLMVLSIANFCTMDDPKKRPHIKVVRCMLSNLVD